MSDLMSKRTQMCDYLAAADRLCPRQSAVCEHLVLFVLSFPEYFLRTRQTWHFLKDVWLSAAFSESFALFLFAL